MQNTTGNYGKINISADHHSPCPCKSVTDNCDGDTNQGAAGFYPDTSLPMGCSDTGAIMVALSDSGAISQSRAAVYHRLSRIMFNGSFKNTRKDASNRTGSIEIPVENNFSNAESGTDGLTESEREQIASKYRNQVARKLDKTETILLKNWLQNLRKD